MLKKILCILLLLLLTGCNSNKQSITPKDEFIELISKYEYNEDLLDDYYNEYQKNNNIIYSINKVNFPNFLNSFSFKTNSITKENILLVNTNYYLDKTYVPNNLVMIPNDIDYIKRDYDVKLEKTTLDNYLLLCEEAKKNNLSLTIFSAYRSFDYQSNLYNNSNNKSYVAKPGTSEHQTGLAIDIGKRNVGLTKDFEHTKEAKFLKDNAHRFGFVLRYPKGKESITGYPYESWHFRYVGKKAAKIIYENNLTIEEYFYNYIKI